MEIRGQLGGSVSFFNHVGFGESRHFSPLSHPADFLVNYFINRKNKWDERLCFSDIGEELFSSKVVDDIQAPGSEPLFF